MKVKLSVNVLPRLMSVTAETLQVNERKVSKKETDGNKC